MGNQTRISTGRYGWTGKVSAEVGMNMGMPEKRCGEAAQVTRAVGPPMPIDEALRTYCNIPGRGYLVVAIDQDYESKVFKSANCPADIDRFVDKKSLQAHLLQLKSSTESQGIDPTQTSTTSYGKNSSIPYTNHSLKRPGSGNLYYQPSVGGLDGDDFHGTRKRLRHASAFEDESEPATPRMAPTPKGRRIQIDNTKDIWDFYEQQFKNCQQTACKLIAKAWVKAVEPKKQSTHPYTGKDEKAPDWWPKPWGNSKDERVRHKEPDHLYKRERVYLLCHILRLVIQPEDSRHQAIQKVNLDVKKLDEITMEALSTFFTDKENPNNEKKRPYLRDIFKVARQEERFKRGEIDPTVRVHVRPDDRASGEDDAPSQVDDDEHHTGPITNEPRHSGALHMVVSHGPLPAGVGATGNGFSGNDFLGDHTRYHHMTGIDNGGVPPVHQPVHHHESLDLADNFMYTTSECPTRRNSAYQSANTDFTSPTTPATPWYTTAAPHPSTLYNMHTIPASHVHNQQSVHLSHNLLEMDDFSRNFGHPATHSGALHDASLDSMSLQHHAAYPGYPEHHGAGLAGPVKLETHHAALGQYPGGR